MSYEKKIENHYVNFVTEIDYLNCRIEYVRLHRDKNSGVSSITFLEFIQYELYDKGECCVNHIWVAPPLLTNLFSTPSSLSTDTNTIGDDTYFGTTTFNGEPVYGTVSVSVSLGNLSPSDFAASVWDMPIQSAYAPGEHKKEKIKEKKKKKKEPPGDPIEDRSDILDLRRE